MPQNFCDSVNLCVNIDKDLFRSLISDFHTSFSITDSGEINIHSGNASKYGLNNTSEMHIQNTIAYVPELKPDHLGDTELMNSLGVSIPCFAGAMYHGITSPEIVIAMGNAGMMGFYGAGGLSTDIIESNILKIKNSLKQKPFGCNLLHSPSEPENENSVVDLLLKHNVNNVSAAAYIQLTLPLIKYRTHGISITADGVPIIPNRVFGKISRLETAQRFFSPPELEHLKALVQIGHLTEQQANIASTIPVADVLTAEGDSGGHTDNRPFITMIPAMLDLRDKQQMLFDHIRLHVGAAGGISTPGSAAAAFSLGSAFVLTGSVNQSCIESATSDDVKAMLATAGQADIMMAPAADMFEMGVKVQVLKKGTMFPMKATRLYEIYKNYRSIDKIPADIRLNVEKTIFRSSIDDIWNQTKDYFMRKDPSQIYKADSEPDYKFALLCRWYLGKASYWAEKGDKTRRIDYQVQCGPSMGAFNEWSHKTFLEHPSERDVVTVNLNIIYGALHRLRANMLRYQGIQLSSDITRTVPVEKDRIKAIFSGKA